MRLRLTRAGHHEILSSDQVERVVATRDLVLEPSGLAGVWLGMAGGMVVYAQEPPAVQAAQGVGQGSATTGPEQAAYLVLRRVNGDLRQAWLADRIDWMTEPQPEVVPSGTL